MRLPDWRLSAWDHYNLVARSGQRGEAARLQSRSRNGGTSAHILICSCEDTMPLDADAVRRGCRGAQVTTAHQLCRAEIERFRAAAAGGEPLTVGCTQEAPLFSEVAGEQATGATHLRQYPRDRRLVDGRRRRPGRRWRRCSRPPPSRCPRFPLVSLDSEGVVLIYGRDERAIEAGKLLEDHLDVTVLITPPDGSGAAARHRVSGGARARSAPPRAISARSRSSVDDYARAGAVVARRACLRRRRATARCRAAISCSISPAARRCFPPPICATAICAPIRAIRPRCCAPCSRRAISSAPSTSRATSPSPRICARIRARRSSAATAASISARPARSRRPAITSRSIAKICAGCGQCAAVCPTGAAAYALPPADALMRKLRALLTAYREAGGEQPDRAAARRGARRAADRCAGAPRRRLAGERAAARGQRGDAGRARSGRGGVRLWRDARCASCCAPSRATTSPDCARPSRWPSRSSPAWASAPAASPPSRPTIPMRSARRCAPSPRCRRRRGRRASRRSAASAT